VVTVFIRFFIREVRGQKLSVKSVAINSSVVIHG